MFVIFKPDDGKSKGGADHTSGSDSAVFLEVGVSMMMMMMQVMTMMLEMMMMRTRMRD